MNSVPTIVLALVLAAALAAAACGRVPAPEAATSEIVANPPAVPTPVAPPVARETAPTPADALLVLVHKSPTCSCCEGWVQHLREAGFVVQVDDTEALDPIKQRLGVPRDKASCHTAEVGGYVIEGHVPAEDIHRLLAEKPQARGLALPGMPIGSPGMGEPGSGPPYTVELIAPDGSSTAFAQH